MKQRKFVRLFIVCCLISICGTAQRSLVPATPSDAPDYFCTWCVQGYAVNYSGAENTRAAINEQSLFGSGKYEGWINFLPKIRSDLYFVMDDSWDIPRHINTGNNNYLGLAELDETRFPSFKGIPRERLKALSDSIRSHGWKGAGGWICAQQSPLDTNFGNAGAYWSARVKDAQYAGVGYWKVDWGKYDRDAQWRKMVTGLGRQYAPQLYIEHAMVNEYVAFSDVFRTYDVETIIAAPVTIQRVASLLSYRAEGQAKGMINCEDEPYIAVGLGCAIGIMRYPFDGNLPDGRQDEVFPPVGRNLKKRMDEIVRAVRWHRIAGPFGVDGDATIDTARLSDYWTLKERETWVNRPVGEKVTASAPARVSRRMPLPKIGNLHNADRPFVLASRYPNGAVAVATIERVSDRSCTLSPETVSIEVTDLLSPIGIFGDYKELILTYPHKIDIRKIKVFGQDLAGNTAVEITKQLIIKDSHIIVPGNLIRRTGLMAASPGDVSAPGMVMQIFRK